MFPDVGCSLCTQMQDNGTTIITPRGPTEDLLLCFRVQGLRCIKGRLSGYPLGSAIAKRQSFAVWLSPRLSARQELRPPEHRAGQSHLHWLNLKFCT